MKKIISLFMIILILMSTICLATTPIEPRIAEKPMLINETTSLETANSTTGDNFILEDEDYTISGKTIDGNEFLLASETSTIDSTIINGNLFIIGDKLEIKDSTITGSAFILAKEVKIENSKISDIYVLGEEIELINNTIIDREVKILGKNINIDSTINGNLYLYGEKVEIGDNAILKGNADIQYTKQYNKSEKVIVNNIQLNQVKQDPEKVKQEEIKTQISEWVEVLLKTSIIVGLIYIFGFKKFNTFIVNDKNRKSMVKMSLVGFASLILIPVIAIMAIFVSFGLLFGISFILLGIYVILIYVSEAIVAFTIALIIRKKYMKKEAKLELFGITLIVASLLWVITKFPIIGGIVNFIVLILGIGIVIEYICKAKKIKSEEEIIIEPEVKE